LRESESILLVSFDLAEARDFGELLDFSTTYEMEVLSTNSDS